MFLYKLVGLKLYRLLFCDFGVNDIATVLTVVQGGRGLQCPFSFTITDRRAVNASHQESVRTDHSGRMFERAAE